MAGYMTKLTHNVYDGEFPNGAEAPVANGVLMVIAPDGKKLILPSMEDDASKFLCREVTTIYDGMPAYRIVVQSMKDQYYFVENLMDYNDAAEYDGTAYTTAAGKLLRAHPLHVGEEFLATSSETLVAGTAYGVKTTGLVG